MHPLKTSTFSRRTREEYEKAPADCDKAIELDPASNDAHLNRGLVWAHRGNQEKAIAEYKQALAIMPHWTVLNDLGVAHWMQAQEQDGKAATADAAGDSETANVCRKRSVALKDQAKEYWVRGITARPTASDILNNLGYA